MESADSKGVWKQIGYGNIIDLNDSKIKVYDITKRNCDFAFEEDILDFAKIIKVTQDTLTMQHGIDHWVFVRLDKLPNLCAAPQTKLVNNPKHNFEVFWDTFDEHYSSFETKGIDWDEIYNRHAPMVSDSTSDVELYSVFQEMIALLNDGHVSIEAPEEIEKAYKQETPGKKYKYSKLDEWAINTAVAELYVDSVRNYNAGMVRYGIINNNVGYVQINSMLAVADYDMSKDLNLQEFWGAYWEIAEQSKDETQREEEVAGINMLMDSIIQEFAGVGSYIIDLRFNGGGKDGVAMTILNHLTDTKALAFRKQTNLESELLHKQEFYVTPKEHNFTGNVYILTSKRTASAAEICVLASLQNPNIVRIGGMTEGIFSSTLDKQLPNGWEYGLSNEVYFDLKGNNYEDVGIEPNYPLGYALEKDEFFDQLSAGIAGGKDGAIEMALELQSKEIR